MHLIPGTWESKVRKCRTRVCLVTWRFINADVHSSELTSHYVYSHSLMELSPSWEAANCAATEEISSILWNPKVYYRVQKSPKLVPILSHINLIHTIPSYISKIHFNIVHPPTSRSSQWSLTFWLPHQYPPPFVLHALPISSSLTWSF
jgi:hypothetical protein